MTELNARTLSEIDTQLQKAEKQIRNIQRKSKQKRFTKKDNNNLFFWNVYDWAHTAESEEPAYSSDSSKRDAWLRTFVMREPFLAGVLANVVSIDRNRGWSLIGGERVVKKNVALLHGFHASPDQVGWRSFLTCQSEAYHCADIGAIAEIEWSGNKFNSLFTVDPALCKLTGNNKAPLEFTDTINGNDSQDWKPDDYTRVADMINTDQAMNGLGVCAVTRALEMAKIMVALYDHDKEKLLAKAPKGLLLLQGISEAQWVQTMEGRTAQMSDLERKYYQGVQVFASATDPIKADLVSLSSIPEGLDHQTFTNIIMYLYALAFKYDPREFWPVSGGQLGTATETEVQHRKATGKGGMDFALAFQENLQNLLPATVEFEFEARDVDGEAQDEALKSAVIGNIVALTNIRDPKTNEPLINFKQARMLLAENEIIPKEWADPSTMIATDKEDTGTGTATSPDGNATTTTTTDYFESTITPASVFFRECIHRSLYLEPEMPIVRYYEKQNETRGQYQVLDIPVDIRKHLSEHKFISILKEKGSTTRARSFSQKKSSKKEDPDLETKDMPAVPDK